MFNTQILAGSSGQGGGIAQQSLKFNDDESQYLSWTPAAAGNRKTWTFAFWLKRGNIKSAWTTIFASASGSQYTTIGIKGSGADTLRIVQDNGAGGVYELLSSAVLRDTSAWYHIVVAMDTTQATSSDRIKFYINGEQQSVTGSYPSQNLDTWISNTQDHYLGGWPAVSEFVDGYLSDVYFIDGQALDPTSFGQFTNGYWEKKDYAGTYGTNGFHLTFQDDVVSEGFNATTYLATEANQSISGIGFSPDLVIVKNRDSSSNARWGVIDSVRGVNKTLATDITNAEVTSQSDLLTSFDADGFSLGADAAAYGWNNTTYTAGDRQVAWCWDAGSGSAASNTDGSITSTVKANPDYGFSIVSWTGNATAGATVGHGLSSTPEMIINKNRIDNAGWGVYHSSLGATKYIWLQESNAAATYSGAWNDTSPTASVFTVGNDGQWNGSGDGMISYCFHSVSGYSSIGSYSGTGAAGNAVTGLGFKPAFLLIKNTTDLGGSGESWYIFDNTRDPVNPAFHKLNPNSSGAESTSTVNNTVDFTADGFDINTTNAGLNYNGDTFIYMAFADTREAAFWKDVSGQGNHWTPNNLDYRDSLPDSPANNFAVMNPLANELNATLSEGNLRVIGTSNEKLIFSTFGVSSGKWYFEAYIENQELRGVVGITDDKGNDGYEYGQNYAQLSTYFGFLNTSATDSGENFSRGCQDGDVISFAIDADNGQVWIKLNSAVNTGSAAFATGLPTDTTYRVHYQDSYASNTIIKFNFGQDSTFAGARPAGGNTDANGIGDFAYAPPSGYLALCTANLPTPTIVDGSEYFNTVLYTGNADFNSVSGFGFQPDLTWVKERSEARDHILVDSVRTVSQALYSNLTSAEGSTSNFTDFLSDGFRVGYSGVDADKSNKLNQTYAAWSWKAGGTAVSNTDGSITSQVSANVDAGFSIVSYTGDEVDGATVGHGLSQKPDLIIIRNRTDAVNWVVMTDVIDGSEDALYLNTAGAKGNASQDVPTSSVFTVDNWGLINGSGDAHIAYCFHSVDGFSKAGSYTGNGSTDGPFVYTGFRPAWLMIKRTDAASDWILQDNKRLGYNVDNNDLVPNQNYAEATDDRLDQLSNGFKLRSTFGTSNASGGTYIYLAFAETPQKFANAR